MPAEQRERLSDRTEHELLRLLQTGNAEAFEILFRRHAPRVARQAIHLLANDAEAEEVVQEVFLTLYEKAQTFRGDAALSTWLYRLTANAALTRLRHRKRRPEVFIDDYLPRFQDDGHHAVRPVVDWSHDLEQRWVTEERRRILHEAIAALPPLDKAVVIFSDLEELSNKEIGDILGLSVPAVKARLHRARLFLRGKLTVALGHDPA